MEYKLRPYQKSAIQAVNASLAKGQNKPILVMATGLGKTVIFGHIIKDRIVDTGKKALVIAHREELLTQAQDKIQKIEPDVTIDIEMAEKYADPRADVVVASVATIGRSMSKRISRFDPAEFGTIVIDEAHHASAPTYKNILRHFGVLKNEADENEDCLLLGVTATPNRMDNEGIDKIFDDVVYNYGIVDGIKDGWLSRIRAYRVNTDTSLENVHTQSGDFAQGELADAVNNEDRNNLIVKTYKDKFLGKQALLFAVDVEHAKALYFAFENQGVKAAVVHGETPKEYRSEILERFHEKKIQVMVNCMVLTEGYDNDTIDAIFMARPTKSGILYTQMIGRGTRPHEDKPFLTVVDFVDNTYRHTIKSAASLLGLDATIQFAGQDVVDSMEKISEIQELSPDYDLNRLDLDHLDYVMEEVDLLSGLEIPNPLQQLTGFAWQRYGRDAYRINLGNNTHLTMEQSLTGQWKVRQETWDPVVHKLSKDELGEEERLEDAVTRCDTYIENNFEEQLILIDMDAKWRHGKPSDKQIAALQRLGVANEVISQLDKGHASALQNKLYTKKTLKKEWHHTGKKIHWR